MLRPTVSEAIVPVPSSNSISDADSDICHYAVLGLQPGATGSDINTAARTFMKLYHPDKGHGDTAKFIQVHEAMLALTGRMPDDCGERKLCVAPKQDKTYEDMTICELSKLKIDCNAYANKLHIELKRVHAVGVEVQDMLQKKHNEANRPKAIEMTNQFRMSAKYWDVAQLKAWFQSDRFEPMACAEWGWERKLEAQYGFPYLRKGNEDLDP